VSNSKYGRALQISSDTFGSDGSVQVIGGTANALQLTTTGSSSENGSKTGMFGIYYGAKKGLGVGDWIEMNNSVRQNKRLGLAVGNTVHIEGNEVTLGSGKTFQTLRPTTQDDTTYIRCERHGDYIALIGVDGTALDLTGAGVREGDWLILGGGLNETWTESNKGVYSVIRIFGSDALWIKTDNFVEETVRLEDESHFQIYSYDSVMENDTLIIASVEFGLNNIGRYVVTSAPVAPYDTIEVDASFVTGLGGLTVALSDSSLSLFNVEENAPLSLTKRIAAIGIGTGITANIITDTAELVSRMTASLQCQITHLGKIGFNTNINYGSDSYRYYNGLIKELTRIIYGDPTNPYAYPGVRAAGTDIDIKPAIQKKIEISLSVRVRIGVAFDAVRDQVKAKVAGYINTLGVGVSVSLSRVVAAAQKVNGVSSVVVTAPVYALGSDMINVNRDQTAFVADPTTDITVTVLSN
jgi:hypothetical protein